MSQTQFLAAFIFTLALSVFTSGVCIKIGKKAGLISLAGVPFTGGIAVVISWWAAAGYFGLIGKNSFVPLLLASILILIIGLWDARKPLSPWTQLAVQISAAGIAVYAAGISIKYITNPFGGVWPLEQIGIFGLAVSSLMTLIWIVTIMNAVNFLDGMDGLAGSVGMVALTAIGLVSLLPQVNDSLTGAAAFAAVAAVAGFLFWNYPPASLYLGTAGSWFIGFLIAVLAAQGATKVATTAVVGAVPLLDAMVVILGRIWRGRSPFKGDLTHLHHRLARRGLSPRSILAIYLACSVILGTAAVQLQTHNKIIVLIVFSLMFALLIIVGSRMVRRRMKSRKPD